MSPLPRSQFETQYAESVKRSAVLRNLPKEAHIHISGVCGTGMASVLQLLKALGYRVSGSDKAFYPPMGEVVRRTADKVYEGYSAENLQPKPDLVVLGNSLVKDNPEVVYTLEQGIPFASMPEVFQALLIGERDFCPTSVVVCGTHGKSTTSAAVATLFESAGRRPGFFIGGIPQNFETSIRPVSEETAKSDRVVVLEGDEYDSAFFAKWSKFLSYRADIALLTSLEFDHADISESMEQIEEEFTRLFQQIPSTGAMIICDEGKEIEAAYARWEQAGFTGKLLRYGIKEDSAFRLLERKPSEGVQHLRFQLRGRELEVETPLGGIHNALNLLGTAAVGDLCGLSLEEIKKGVESFRGVVRRQQLIAEINDIRILEDFAHHPTAVQLTLQGMKEQNLKRRLVAVFEPRSNSSRRAIFQEPYAESFRSADVAVIQEVVTPAAYSVTSTPAGMLDVKRLIADINEKGTEAASFLEVSQIEDYLLTLLAPGDTVVLMSNGDFGGLMRSLPEKLKKKFSEK